MYERTTPKYGAQDKPSLAVAVAFFIFNRPWPTDRVFQRIRFAQPRQLFIVGDGPRVGNRADIEKCALARSVTEQIDWPCTVYRNYAEINLGCGKRVASGLDWVFSHVEEAIILEDDCLPDVTFFPFCAELLERYREEPRVALISGSHHQRESSRVGSSYYFCRYGNIWGWATWRRAWKKFDLAMSDWVDWRDAGGMERLFPDKAVREFWRGVWNETAAGMHDTWDYQWTYCYMRHRMLGILPRISLIENIGFGQDATHTNDIEQRDGGPKTEHMIFPLRHPLDQKPDLQAEAEASRRFFSRPSFFKRLAGRIKRLGGVRI